jgi:hypothetical protein
VQAHDPTALVVRDFAFGRRKARDEFRPPLVRTPTPAVLRCLLFRMRTDDTISALTVIEDGSGAALDAAAARAQCVTTRRMHG